MRMLVVVLMVVLANTAIAEDVADPVVPSFVSKALPVHYVHTENKQLLDEMHDLRKEVGYLDLDHLKLSVDLVHNERMLKWHTIQNAVAVVLLLWLCFKPLLKRKNR